MLSTVPCRRLCPVNLIILLANQALWKDGRRKTASRHRVRERSEGKLLPFAMRNVLPFVLRLTCCRSRSRASDCNPLPAGRKHTLSFCFTLLEPRKGALLLIWTHGVTLTTELIACTMLALGPWRQFGAVRDQLIDADRGWRDRWPPSHG